MQNFSETTNFLWSVADLIRDTFKRGKYQDVILPFTVLRRIDCVLAPTKEKVLEKYQRYKKDLENLDPVLCRASGYAFYNTSPYDFERLLDDSAGLADNLKATIHAFSSNMREVLPHVPDAWIDAGYRDTKDGEVGRVGYEINFNRYFYVYQPPRPLGEIEADIKVLEAEILKMLREVTE